MIHRQASFIEKNAVFAWLALATGLFLLVPLIAMQFTSQVNWTMLDFVVAGLLVYLAGSLFIGLTRRLPRKHWRATGFGVGVLFVYVWAELAVGIFTNLGS